jgi:hypothetical protein
MNDADPLIAALTGRSVTPELVDAARRYLVMLRSLLEEVQGSVPRLAAPSSSSWRSITADRYAEGLSDLHVQLLGARDQFVSAEYGLVERIRRMEGQLEAQRALAPQSVPSSTLQHSPPTRGTR